MIQIWVLQCWKVNIWHFWQSFRPFFLQPSSQSPKFTCVNRNFSAAFWRNMHKHFITLQRAWHHHFCLVTKPLSAVRQVSIQLCTEKKNLEFKRGNTDILWLIVCLQFRREKIKRWRALCFSTRCSCLISPSASLSFYTCTMCVLFSALMVA